MIIKYLNYFIYKINKKISVGCKSQSGRNFLGHICVHHQGGGNKKKYYFIDFFRRLNSFGVIYKIIKCANRTGFIGGILYENGLFSYILLSEKIRIGEKLYAGINCKINKDKLGNSVPLKQLRLFTLLNNIEKYPYVGGQISRSAGTYGIITTKQFKNVIIKLNSGWNLTLSKNCISTIGIVSNMLHKFENITKAGISRSLGIRPSVRGVAMNPHDHPHGGGEGKKSPPANQVSPWGWLTKGTPSLKKKEDKKKRKLYKSIIKK